jgi:hypothetical protein
MKKRRTMCELSTRARAFSVEALIGVKHQRSEEPGKNQQLIFTYKEHIGKRIFVFWCFKLHRPCGLVARVLGYRSGGPGSIPGTTRKKKQWVWNGVHSASRVQRRSYLIEK